MSVGDFEIFNFHFLTAHVALFSKHFFPVEFPTK